MSFTERLWVWLHVAFVVFTIGPVTIATMSTPRYIRAGNIGVLRYLSRMTRIFGAASLGVLLFGIIAGQSLHKMAQAWITASLTLFVVALVLLVLIMRDQTRAIGALEAAQGQAAEPGAAEATAADVEPAPAAPAEPAAEATGTATEATGTATEAAGTATATRVSAAHVASMERGRIASLAGVVSLIWLVILVLMIWNS